VHGRRVVPEEERLVRFACFSIQSRAFAVISSSMVSMRFFVSGPVSFTV
jgi:hypothetical protein